MTLDELIAETRRAIDDTVTPEQWTTLELTRYLNDAQDAFARHTLCLADSTSPLASLTTVAGVNRYPMDARILRVYSVQDDASNLLNGVPTNRLSMSGTGRPRRFTTRNDPHSVLLWPTPDAEYTLSLFIARRPLEPMESGGDEPEIPEEFHLVLCDWAAHRALRMVDPDNENAKAGERFEVSWWLKVRDAKREMYRFNTVRSAPSILFGGW